MRNISSFSSDSRTGPVFLLFCLLLSCASTDRASPDLPLFRSLNDWLYRGAQPTEEGFRGLRAKGIQTIVNFQKDRKEIEWERNVVEALGMRYVSLPWSVVRKGNPELLDQFFEALDESKNRPIFFHCKQGRDRTGVMATLAFMRYESLSEEEAREKALGEIKPQLRYRFFVNRKIKFFLKERPGDFFREGRS